MVAGAQHVLEHVVSHAAALGDALCFVESPVDAEIDPTLPVFLFRLREGGETAFHNRPEVAGVITCHPVELIRDKTKPDTIGFVVVPEYLEECPAESGMAGGIGRERRGKVRPCEIAGRRPK